MAAQGGVFGWDLVVGVLYLYMKSIERSHTPNALWERLKLPKDYAEALKVIDTQMVRSSIPKFRFIPLTAHTSRVYLSLDRCSFFNYQLLYFILSLLNLRLNLPHNISLLLGLHFLRCFSLKFDENVN